MRKNLRLFFTALLCAVMGQAMAQEVTLDFTSNGWNLPEGSTNKATAAANFTNADGYTITLQGDDGYYFHTQGYLLLGKTDATLTLPAFNFNVAKIVVTGKSGASASTKQNIFVGETAVSTETIGATGTNTYEIAAGSQAAGTIYTLKVLSKHNTQITKIEIYKAGSQDKATPNMVFSKTSINVVVGDDFEAPTLTYDGDGTVTYSSDNEDVATVDANTGEVDVVAAGTANITATAKETSNYKAATASYKITAAEPQGTHEIADGVFDFTDQTAYGSGLTPKGNDLYTGENSYETEPSTWTAGNITLLVEGKYRWWHTASGNTLRLYSNLVDEVETTKLTLSAPAGKIISQIDFKGSNTNDAFTANVGDFSEGKWTGEAQSVVLTYTGTGTKQIQTIKVTYTDGEAPGEKQDPKMSFSTNYVTMTIGETFTAPTLTYTGDGTVTYESDNTEVAEVDAATGAVTIKAVGIAKITATATETDLWNAKSAYYTINVGEPQGTHEVVDGTFNFTDLTDYGSGLTPSTADEYLTEPVTWTAGNVTLVSSGKFRWWKNNGGNTLRLYKALEGEETAKITLSVPDGNTITKITFTGKDITFNVNTGECSGTTNNNIWTGNSQSVELTYGRSSGTIQIETITVEYGPSNRIETNLAWTAETADATLGEAFTAPTLSWAEGFDGTGITYSSSDESVATIDANGAVTIVGAGTTTITATVETTDQIVGSSASYTLTVTDPDVLNVTYDFTGTNDYGTGLVPTYTSSNADESYIWEDNTWTNTPVSLVTSGKYRYWQPLADDGNTLRLYTTIPKDAAEGTEEGSKLTFSVPEGKTITAIDFDVDKPDSFTPNVGTFSSKSWTGDAQNVVLTLASGKKPYIKTITVTYKSASTTPLLGDVNGDGDVSVTDITTLVDAILISNFSNIVPENSDVDGSGDYSVSDVMAIVDIILGKQ